MVQPLKSTAFLTERTTRAKGAFRVPADFCDGSMGILIYYKRKKKISPKAINLTSAWKIECWTTKIRNGPLSVLCHWLFGFHFKIIVIET